MPASPSLTHAESPPPMDGSRCPAYPAHQTATNPKRKNAAAATTPRRKGEHKTKAHFLLGVRNSSLSVRHHPSGGRGRREDTLVLYMVVVLNLMPALLPVSGHVTQPQAPRLLVIARLTSPPMCQLRPPIYKRLAGLASPPPTDRYRLIFAVSRGVVCQFSCKQRPRRATYLTHRCVLLLHGGGRRACRRWRASGGG